MIITLVSILIFLIFAPYVFYPIFLVVLSYLAPYKEEKYQKSTPYITMIIPTFNEEKVIQERIRNLEDLSYPPDKTQIIIIDSGSKDKTYETAAELTKNSSLDFLVLKQDERKGKANAVNHALQYAKGEIILVSDANSLFKRNSLIEISKPFVNNEVGGAGGRFITTGDTKVGKGEEFYWSIEGNIRKAESRIYSMTNFSGEFNAFRKSLGLSLDETSLCEDLDLTLQIIKKGYKVLYCDKAVVYEPAVESSRDLIVQKKRRAVGALQVIFKYKGMILESKYLVFNLLFFFHRTLRLFTPIFAGMLLILLCFLSIFYEHTYKFTLIGLLLALVITTLVITDLVLKMGLIRKIYWFILVQYSYILAWYEYLTGRYKVTWEKTESSRDLKNIINKTKG